jgi:hypothetical protein
VTGTQGLGSAWKRSMIPFELGKEIRDAIVAVELEKATSES